MRASRPLLSSPPWSKEGWPGRAGVVRSDKKSKIRNPKSSDGFLPYKLYQLTTVPAACRMHVRKGLPFRQAAHFCPHLNLRSETGRGRFRTKVKVWGISLAPSCHTPKLRLYVLRKTLNFSQLCRLLCGKALPFWHLLYIICERLRLKHTNPCKFHPPRR